ncbi:uncharacterized protein [Musca autumnalis]|uniref:uncharacterized protein n=1 Tax=Musca autumnalis TaxID=221902 RepID=UPI003CF8B146
MSRPALWTALAVKGIPEKIIQLCKEMYRDSEIVVNFNGHLSDPFETSTGVKQGCVLSPTLFLILLDTVMEKTNRDAPRGIQWTINEHLQDIDSAVGLRLNIKKTKLMRINTSTSATLNIEGEQIEEVDKFCYLGSMLSKNGGSEEVIQMRINKARVAFLSLHKVWRSSRITRRTKMQIFNASIMSVLPGELPKHNCRSYKHLSTAV